MPTAISTNDVVARAIQRDPDAFAWMNTEYSPCMFRHIYYLVVTRHEAEDLTSETFLRAWKP